MPHPGRSPITLAVSPLHFYNVSMNQAANLFQLQKIDRQIDQINQRLSDIRALLSQDEALIKAEKQVAEAKRNTLLARQSLRAIEDDTKVLVLKKEQSESSLYSGKITNPKELKDLEAEIASLKKRINALEDTQLEKMIEVEACENQEKEMAEELLKFQADSISQNSILNGERAQLEQKLARFNAERDVAMRAISQENLEVYNRLRAHKKGIAIAVIQDTACAVCGASLRPAEIQAAKSGQEMSYCSSCGRILYTG